jgi:hypothetical protein
VELLKKHNEYRITVTKTKNVVDEAKAKKLETIRIRDLKMVIVDIARF